MPSVNARLEDEALAAAQEILGEPVERATLAGGGANSRLFKIHTAGTTYALKNYPVLAGDTRDRLEVERRALTFFAEHGEQATPRWCGSVNGYGLLTWLDGDVALPARSSDVPQAAEFLKRLHDMRLMPGARNLPFAYQACKTAQTIVDDLDLRLQRLEGVADQDRDLRGFLKVSLKPVLKRAIAHAQNAYAQAGMDWAAPVDAGYSLISGDFGFHNCMRRSDGSLAFIDFEYFGWDDPVKGTADVLAHPSTVLALHDAQEFRLRMEAVYNEDAFFAPRLQALLPLIGLRWATILCNEFLPERWAARPTRLGQQTWEEAKAAQLQKAQTYMSRRIFEV